MYVKKFVYEGKFREIVSVAKSALTATSGNISEGVMRRTYGTVLLSWQLYRERGLSVFEQQRHDVTMQPPMIPHGPFTIGISSEN